MINRHMFIASIVLGFVHLAACDQSQSPATTTSSAELTTTDSSNDLHHSGIRPLSKPHFRTVEVALGKRLFFDVRLSADNTLSCASCHSIADGGDDGRKTAVGIGGAIGPINTPTVINAGLNFAQFWDGRASTLHDQVEGPIHNELEMGSSWDEVLAKLKKDEDIVAAFTKVYGEDVTAGGISSAIAAYEQALVATGSQFDQYLLGDEDAISGAAKRGYERFVGLGCVACHQGRNMGGNMYQRLGVIGDYFADRGGVTDTDYGRFNVTGREEDRFHFKVPSLRNIAETAPYFHDGSAASLEDAVATMVRYQLGRKITPDELSDIVAFLETLTGSVGEELM